MKQLGPLHCLRYAATSLLAALALGSCAEGAPNGDTDTSEVEADAGPVRGSNDAGNATTDANAGTADAAAISQHDAATRGSDASASRDAAGTNGGDAAAPDSSSAADASKTDTGPLPEPGDCVIPKLAAASLLSAQAKHPDPFKMLDGSRITRKDQWHCRRAEIQAQVEEYESGPKPDVAADDVRASWAGNKLSITVGNSGKSVQFSVTINRPANAGPEPIPLLIAFTTMSLDSSVFTQNGVATTTFTQDMLGAQSGAGSRGTGLFYDLYGKDHPASSMVAWAWGVSRILDALEKTPDAKIDPRRVGVSGCSRYGKGALLAGALDERVALTIPQESGAGGSASWRVAQAQSAMGVNVQTLSSAAGEQPWFRASFGTTFGGSNVTKLPFDHHMLMGLVAPRPLLVIDNAIDWLGIDSTFTAGSIAHSIWEALGKGDSMGYSQSSGHTHCQFPSQQRAILDAYVKAFLVGGAASGTRVLSAASAKADLNAWMDWTAPTLQ